MWDYPRQPAVTRSLQSPLQADTSPGEIPCVVQHRTLTGASMTRSMIRPLAATAAAFLVACGGDASSNGDTSAAATTSGGGIALTGAGATFPYPLYSKWF